MGMVEVAEGGGGLPRELIPLLFFFSVNHVLRLHITKKVIIYKLKRKYAKISLILIKH
jgi:hypothetical protein